VIALGRYVTASCLDALRWVAPGLVFAVGLAVTYASGGNTLSTLADGATLLFPITAWITVATLNDEDPSQAAITAVAAGGVIRARTAKLAVAVAAGGLLTVISLATAYATNSSGFTWDDLGAGALAHTLAVTGGVAVGSLCARPLVSRTALGALVIIALTIVDVVIPYGPPVRIMLLALNRAHVGQQWAYLGIGAGEVLVLAAVLISLSNRLVRSRA
jgi:hypothetical protein